MGRVRSAVATAHEIYALGILRGLSAQPGRTVSFSEEQLRAVFGGKGADLAVEYGHSWIVFEVTITGLQAGTFAGTSDTSFQNDVDDFVKKVRQIDNTSRNLRTGAQTLTHTPPQRHCRFFPLLVVVNRYTNSPAFMALLLERLQSENLLAGVDVSQLEVMSIEDLVVAEGAMGEHGTSFVDLRIAKAQSNLTRMSTKDYLLAPTGRSIGRPERVDLASKRYFATAMNMVPNPAASPGAPPGNDYPSST
jgi:hypothetical protein